VELVDFPIEMRRSDDAKYFVEQMKEVYVQVKNYFKMKRTKYKESLVVHIRFKSFEVGNEVMVHLRRDNFVKGT
jgi:hypothetical protein